MPLPKLPSKPAALLSESAIEEANRSKPRLKPGKNHSPLKTNGHAIHHAEIVSADVRARAPIDTPRAPLAPMLSVVPQSHGQPRKRDAGDGPPKLFVLDTNVLMHAVPLRRTRCLPADDDARGTRRSQKGHV
jgi:PhoH-like ATPase